MVTYIKRSDIVFKNPQVGQPTRYVEEHYNGRRVIANVDGEDKFFRLQKEDVPFNAEEDQIIQTIENKQNSAE